MDSVRHQRPTAGAGSGSAGSKDFLAVKEEENVEGESAQSATRKTPKAVVKSSATKKHSNRAIKSKVAGGDSQGWRANAKRVRKMQSGEELERKAGTALGNLMQEDLFQSTTPQELDKLANQISSFASDPELMKSAASDPSHIEAAMDLRDRLRPIGQQCALAKAVIEGMKKPTSSTELAISAQSARSKGIQLAGSVDVKICEMVLGEKFTAGLYREIGDIIMDPGSKKDELLPTIGSLDAKHRERILDG